MSRRKKPQRERGRGVSVLTLLWGVPLALALVGAWQRHGGRPPGLAIGEAAAGKPPADGHTVAPRPSKVFGDAWLRGEIDLSKRTTDGQRYFVPLAGGGKAALTLDPTLQTRAETLLAEADAPYGAIVIMRPDGRILALAARSTAEPGAGVAELALRPWAPSASIFKLVTASALVDAGVEPDEKVCVHGGLRSIDADNLVDDKKRDDLCEDLTYGLAKSQNAIVAKLASRHLDRASLASMAGALGFGVTPDFALGASPSTIDLPDGDPLELARASAGFWHSELSPLGAVLMTTTLADGGLMVTPRIVEAVIDADGVERPLPAVAPRRAMDPDTAQAVGEMMVQTTEMGTAYKAFHDAHGKRLLDVTVAGKTGSLSREQPSYLNYSWFVGFAPADSPQVVVAVLLGNSATWRMKAHMIARILFETALAE